MKSVWLILWRKRRGKTWRIATRIPPYVSRVAAWAGVAHYQGYPPNYADYVYKAVEFQEKR